MKLGRLQRSWLVVAALAAARCAASPPGDSGGLAGGATSSSGSGGATTTGGGASSTGGTSSSRSTTGTTSTGTGGKNGCSTVADCPSPPGACVLSTCNAGTCGEKDVAAGTVLMKDSPPDCHDTVCDGMGNVVPAVDVNNAPASTDPCLVATCDTAGAVHTGPAAPGGACTSAPGGKVCDGAGHCVACLRAGDCAAGQTCSPTNTCVPLACMNGRQDGSETDLDCGGSCSPCATGKTCKLDPDCTTGACDALSLTCVASPCADHRTDGDESDVDCGGSCPTPCALDQGCVADADCITNACDGVSHTCVVDQCADHRPDGDETDADCGGLICTTRCPIGKACLLDTDCDVPYACDGTSLTCVSSQCSDHRQDGVETDVDCGGANGCLRCASGQTCARTTDCRAGHVCSATQICN